MAFVESECKFRYCPKTNVLGLFNHDLILLNNRMVCRSDEWNWDKPESLYWSVRKVSETQSDLHTGLCPVLWSMVFSSVDVSVVQRGIEMLDDVFDVPPPTSSVYVGPLNNSYFSYDLAGVTLRE